jgi:hypothetical protein
MPVSNLGMRHLTAIKLLVTRCLVIVSAIVLWIGDAKAVAQAGQDTPPDCAAADNAITVKIADAAVVERLWGKEEKGVRVDLTLDKLNFQLGEDIALHIAAEVLSAEKPVYGEPFRRRGAFFGTIASSFHLSIMDENGPLPGTERRANLYVPGFGSSGPAVCPGPLPVGKVIPSDKSLKALGLLPRRPGTYQLMVAWSPYRTNLSSCDSVSNNNAVQLEKPFVTAKSQTLTIHVVGIRPVTDVPEFPEYTAWKSAFDLTETSFGEKTALFDQATGLAWLHPNLTANLPEEEVRKRMEVGGEFEGWRFAIASEVKNFLADFTSSPNGETTNPAIVRKLIRLLGGDAETGIRNNETAWSRIEISAHIAGLMPAACKGTPSDTAHPPGSPVPGSTCNTGFVFHYAYIGEDREHGQVSATVKPYEKGWVRSDGVVNPGGFFLVREQLFRERSSVPSQNRER